MKKLPNVDIFTFIEADDEILSVLKTPIVSLKEDISHIQGNSRKMFYRMMKLQEAFEPYSSNYDKVIRLRPDLSITHFPLRLLDETRLVVFPRLSLPLSNQPRAITDVFFLGSVSDMRTINNIYSSYIKTNCNNPELFLYNFIKLHNIPFVFEEKMKVTTASTDVSHFRVNLKNHIATITTIMSNDGC